MDLALGKVIRNARLQRGKRVQDIAAQLGIDSSLIVRFENGNRLPTKSQVIALAEVLELQASEIMVLWLSARIMKELDGEPLAMQALMAAEQQVSYQINSSNQFQGYEEKLSALNDLKKQLDGLRSKVNYRIEEALDVEYTFHSNRIEGNTLTLQETDLVINQGLTISGKSMREHLEAINHSDAVAFIKELVQEKRSITESIILQIHNLVLRGIDRENAGKYRSLQVRIGGSSHVPPDAWEVPMQMEQLLEWYRKHEHIHPVLLAAEMHARLVAIHPFIDGNGRTSRLLMNLILLQHGYVIANIKGDTPDRLLYYQSLEHSRKDGDMEFNHFVLDTEMECLNNYISILKGNIK
jgi:Fic family protein/transposase-like protein